MKELKDRKTLKGYFKKGSIPTEEQFAALIDSVPNIAEDGQAVRTADGWSFYPRPWRNWDRIRPPRSLYRNPKKQAGRNLHLRLNPCRNRRRTAM